MEQKTANGKGLRCRYCDAHSLKVKILDSNAVDKYGYRLKRRRRHCTECGKRWTTYEINEDEFQNLVAFRMLKIINELHEMATEDDKKTRRKTA